jgi:quercetin dioxygenase-like cupin family protein
MRGLLAKLVNGEITRREFAERILGAGFGVVTAESILDTVAVAQDKKKAPPVHHRGTFHIEPFSEMTPYEQWMEHEGVPVHTGYHVADVRALEVKPWKRLGASGALINLEGAEATDGAYICEIAPRARTKPQRYMFEESIYVLNGEGETTVWHERGARRTFKWKKGALFSPPLNTWRQHVNRGDLPARFISVTDAPLVFDLFHSAEFIFNNDFVFRDRYRGESDHFTANESKLRAAGSAATFGEGEKGAVGATPAKYMATTWIGGKYFVKAMGGGGRTHRLNNISHKHGGNMIDHPDEDPMIRAMFEEELKKNGVEARMPSESKLDKKM